MNPTEWSRTRLPSVFQTALRWQSTSSDWPVYAAIWGYFLLQAAIRPLYGPSLALDEAEAFWFSQHLAPGYGPQPPLYFWLQWAVLQVIGPNLWALSALKALLLAGALSLIYGFVRPEASRFACATAALSLGLLPELCWEGQRDLTHTVLVFFMAVLATRCFWMAIHKGSVAAHGAFGLVVGLGLLSKFNFAQLLLALLVAALILPELRHRIRPGYMALAMLVAAATVAPYAFWAVTHPEIAAGSMHKLAIAEGGAVMARLSAMLSFGEAVLSLFAVALLVLAYPLYKHRRSLPLLRGRGRYLAAVALAAIVVTLALMLVSGAEQMRGRWLMPITWPLMPVAILWLWPSLASGLRRFLTAISASGWVIAMVGLLAASGSTYRAADFHVVASNIPAETPILSDDLWLLGNLSLAAPARTLVHIGSDETPLKGSVVIMSTLSDLETLARKHGATLSTVEELRIPGGQRRDDLTWARIDLP